ncbi:MAG: hypothetical protein ACHQ1H_05815 [Nitrososphaerales archaeon]
MDPHHFPCNDRTVADGLTSMLPAKCASPYFSIKELQSGFATVLLVQLDPGRICCTVIIVNYASASSTVMSAAYKTKDTS